ncbi:MAG: hypothetical protein PHW73_01715 [Atribacterota bacterium]|nr:hypothetical protein [Atribacterota bacterium]
MKTIRDLSNDELRRLCIGLMGGMDNPCWDREEMVDVIWRWHNFYHVTFDKAKIRLDKFNKIIKGININEF